MFYASDSTCGGYRSGVWTGPARCQAAPVAAGLVFYEKPRPATWWAFACAEHTEDLIAPRPLLDRDQTEMARRREQTQRTPPVKVEPLAVGSAARELVPGPPVGTDAHPEATHMPRQPGPTQPNRPT